MHDIDAGKLAKHLAGHVPVGPVALGSIIKGARLRLGQSDQAFQICRCDLWIDHDHVGNGPSAGNRGKIAAGFIWRDDRHLATGNVSARADMSRSPITRNKTSIITVEQNDAFLGLKRHLLYGTSTVVRQPVACRATVSNVTAISAVQAGSRERISARQSAFLLKPRYSC